MNKINLRTALKVASRDWQSAIRRLRNEADEEKVRRSPEVKQIQKQIDVLESRVRKIKARLRKKHVTPLNKKIDQIESRFRELSYELAAVILVHEQIAVRNKVVKFMADAQKEIRAK